MITSAVLESSDQGLSNERSTAQILQVAEEQQRLENEEQVAELRVVSEPDQFRVR